MIDLAITIDRLKNRKAVDKLMPLLAIRKRSDLANDRDYQKAFNGYYRLSRQSADFYQSFYSLFFEVATGKELPRLEVILTRLHEMTGKRHLSFSTKLLATLDDSFVIFDRNVAGTAGVSTSLLPEENWVGEALRRYAGVHNYVVSFTQTPVWPGIETTFDSKFPQAIGLPAIRKADLLIWAAYDAPSGTSETT